MNSLKKLIQFFSICIRKPVMEKFFAVAPSYTLSTVPQNEIVVNRNASNVANVRKKPSTWYWSLCIRGVPQRQVKTIHVNILHKQLELTSRAICHYKMDRFHRAFLQISVTLLSLQWETSTFPYASVFNIFYFTSATSTFLICSCTSASGKSRDMRYLYPKQ